MRIGPWILLLGAVACGGNDDGVATGDTSDTGGGGGTIIITPAQRPQHVVDLVPTGDVAAGQILYEGDPAAGVPGCAECHNFDGSGTEDFPSLTDRLPLIDDLRCANVILDGLPPLQPGAQGMPAYKTEWSDPEIANVIAYIRSAFQTAAR